MKLNHTGTHPVHTDLTIADAIAFHEMIGTKRKEARLRYLQTYWTSQVRGTKNVTLFTPADPARSCAIANVGVTGIVPADLAKTLLDKYRIWCNGVNTAGVTGVAHHAPCLHQTVTELDQCQSDPRSQRRADSRKSASTRVGPSIRHPLRARACKTPIHQRTIRFVTVLPDPADSHLSVFDPSSRAGRPPVTSAEQRG